MNNLETNQAVSITFRPLAVKVKVAAQILDTSETAVKNLIKDGKIKAMKSPIATISYAELERFVKWASESDFDFKEYGDPYFMKKKKQKIYNIRKA
nr:MAG TPA: Regulatory protein [Caudoviricetes sp.]